MAAPAAAKAAFSWTEFFKSAGIPDSHASTYAEVFEENRIRQDMLLDLNKEILQEMGVVLVGDIIAICKHAKALEAAKAKSTRRKPEQGGSPQAQQSSTAGKPQAAAAPAGAGSPAPGSKRLASGSAAATAAAASPARPAARLTKIVFEDKPVKATADIKKHRANTRLGKLGSHSLFLPDNDDTDFDPEQIDASVDAMLGAAKKRQRISKEETPTKTTDPATPDKFAMRLSSGKVASKSPASSAAASSKSPSAVFSRLGTNPKNAAAGNAAAAGKATAATKNGGSTSIFSRISKESPSGKRDVFARLK